MENAFRYWNATSALRLVRTRATADINVGFATGNHGDGNDFDGPGRSRENESVFDWCEPVNKISDSLF